MLSQQFRHSGHNERQCHSLHAPISNAVDFSVWRGCEKVGGRLLLFDKDVKKLALTGSLFKRASFSQNRIQRIVLG